MDKILTTGDTYKFESGDKLQALAMRTIRDRINEIVGWINAKDNNQGGNTDDPGSGDDPTQDPTTDPEQPKKSISIKLLSESSNNAVIKIDIKNAVGSQWSLAEYISSGSLSYEGYTKRTVGSNDSSYQVTVSKKDSTYKVVGVIYGNTNILSNVIDIKAKDTEQIPESNAPTISEQQVHENENSVEISVVASNAKLKYISLVEVNKQTNTNTLVPGARENYITTENNFAFGWTIERRSEDFYVKAILHDLVLQPSDLNNPIYSTDEILIKAKTASGGDGGDETDENRLKSPAQTRRAAQSPTEYTTTLEQISVSQPCYLIPYLSMQTSQSYVSEENAAWYSGEEYNNITPLGGLGFVTNDKNAKGLKTAYKSWVEDYVDPGKYLGSQYIFETTLQIDDANYCISTFLRSTDDKWFVDEGESAHKIYLSTVPSIYQIFNDPNKYNRDYNDYVEEGSSFNKTVEGQTESKPIISYVEYGQYATDLQINNAVYVRFTLDYGGTRIHKLTPPVQHPFGSGKYYYELLNEDGEFVKDRYIKKFYHPVAVRRDHRMSLAIGVIRDDAEHTKWNKICTSEQAAGEVVDDALLNEYDPRFRFIIQEQHKAEIDRVIYNCMRHIDSHAIKNDSIILDPGHEYHVMNNTPSSKLKDPVPVYKVILYYIKELLLDYIGPKMPWETDGISGWETDLREGYTLLNLYTRAYWHNDAEAIEKINQICENRLEQAKQRFEQTNIWGQLSNTDRYFYDKIDFKGSNWTNLQSRQTIKNIVQGDNKSTVRNKLDAILTNYLNNATLVNMEDGEGYGWGNSADYEYYENQGFQHINKSQWESIVAEATKSDTPWDVEKLTHVIYYKDPDDGQYKIVYTCCRDNEVKYFVMDGPASLVEHNYLYGHITEAWANMMIECAYNTYVPNDVRGGQPGYAAEGTYAGQKIIKWLDRSLFTKCKKNAPASDQLFWVKGWPNFAREDHYNYYFDYKNNGDDFDVALFDYDKFSYQVGAIPNVSLPDDITLPGITSQYASSNDYVANVAENDHEGMLSYFCQRHNVQIYRVGDINGTGTLDTSARGYGFIIDGVSVKVTDTLNMTYTWDKSGKDYVSGGYIVGGYSSIYRSQQSSPYASISLDQMSYPDVYLEKKLIEDIRSQGYSITTRPLQGSITHKLPIMFARKLAELSLLYYDQHPESMYNEDGDLIVMDYQRTERYGYSNVNIYDNTTTWVNNTIRESIGCDKKKDIMPRLSKIYFPQDWGSWTDTYMQYVVEGPCNEGQGSWDYTQERRFYNCSGMTLYPGDIFIVLRHSESQNDNCVGDIWLIKDTGGLGVFADEGHAVLSSGLSLWSQQEVANFPIQNMAMQNVVGRNGKCEYGTGTKTFSDEEGDPLKYVPVSPQETVKNFITEETYGRFGGNYTFGAFVMGGTEPVQINQLRMNTLMTWHPAVEGTHYKAPMDFCGYNIDYYETGGNIINFY